MESMRTNDPPVGDPTAVFGRRCVAFAVDFIIVFAVFVAAFLSSSTLEDVEDSRIADQICVYYDELGNGDVCLDLSLVFVLESGRFADIALWGIVASALNLVVVAAITGGSLGKLAAGIRVVDRNTFNRAGVHKHLLRWVLWVVDAFPWFLPVPLTGLIFSLVSRGHRRVGDFAAKTLVVDKKYVGIPTLVPGVNEAAMATAALPGLWSPP
ncbi:MAG: RDD family protein, partial [Acidimicrobiia bacterium]|nr:RDD family protein [Acidimicrobiia bacterium]